MTPQQLDERDSIEPISICEFRAGERIGWHPQGNINKTCTGTIHEIRWMEPGWLIGAWIEGESRQLKDDGKPRLHWFPIWALNCQIWKVK